MSISAIEDAIRQVRQQLADYPTLATSTTKRPLATSSSTPCSKRWGGIYATWTSADTKSTPRASFGAKSRRTMSLGITSNLVFSEWERIFANPMATAAAIDRVVHHSVILEFDVPSYRTNAAQQRGQAKEVNRQN